MSTERSDIGSDSGSVRSGERDSALLREYAVVTLFPQMLEALTGFGVSGRAFRSGLCRVHCVNPRDFATDKHGSVDDKPYGGGPGMVMAYPPLASAIERARARLSRHAKVVLLSPQGGKLDQAGVARLSQQSELILLCGRYEGIDERVVEDFVDEEVSVGDYVVSGGELPAMLLLDAMIRLLPGALGDSESAAQDSFAGEGLLDYPHYTRPEQLPGHNSEGVSESVVPQVLLSGDHAAIDRWRMRQAIQRTLQRRPDMLERLQSEGRLTEEQMAILARLSESPE